MNKYKDFIHHKEITFVLIWHWLEDVRAESHKNLDSWRFQMIFRNKDKVKFEDSSYVSNTCGHLNFSSISPFVKSHELKKVKLLKMKISNFVFSVFFFFFALNYAAIVSTHGYYSFINVASTKINKWRFPSNFDIWKPLPPYKVILIS